MGSGIRSTFELASLHMFLLDVAVPATDRQATKQNLEPK